jgi:hypothetical protein
MGNLAAGLNRETEASMTRYLCVHPTHAKDGVLRPVDVTAQVRLERDLLPREPVFFAVTDDVIDRMVSLPHTDSTERTIYATEILTGSTEPPEGSVVLMPAGVVDRPPGRYEMDDLRTEPAVDGLLRSVTESNARIEGTGEVVFLSEVDEGRHAPAATTGAAGVSGVLQEAPASQRTRSVPMGVYRVSDLAHALGNAPADRASIVEAIRLTPMPRETRAVREIHPWRVVIQCPVPAGDPKTSHEIVFTGTEVPEPAQVFGVSLAGREALYEETAETELAPAMSIQRARDRLRVLIAGAALIALGGGLIAWLSGGLGFAVREVPGWLAAAVLFAIAGFAVAAFGLSSPAFGRRLNLNDTLVVRRVVDDRTWMMDVAAVTAGVLFTLALLLAVVPPIAAASGPPPVPAPTVEFNTVRQPASATVTVSADDVATDEALWLEVDTFSGQDAPPTLVERASANGDAAGHVTLSASPALAGDTRFLVVRVWFDDEAPPVCTPRVTQGAGCTVLAVPGSVIAGVTATSPSVAPTTPPTTVPTTAPTTSAPISPSGVIPPSVVSPTKVSVTTASPPVATP